jgi:hypothetical protein
MLLAVVALWVSAVLPAPVLAQSSIPGNYSMTPDAGPHGTKVVVKGSVADSGTVSASWDGRDVVSCAPAPKDCPDPDAHDAGGFRMTFRVPPDVSTGEHRVQLCVDICEAAAASWTFTVTSTPMRIDSAPDSTTAGQSVEVSGNTGTCIRQATLTFHATTDLSGTVTGDASGAFAATIPIPRGLFPGEYELELSNRCRERDVRMLTVVNHPPALGDDAAETTRGEPVEIAVTKNDNDPDGDDGYEESSLEPGAPAHGAIEVRPDGLLYTPAADFVGLDRFQYSLCEIVGADGRGDCGSATVTVTVRDPGASGPGGSNPGGNGPAATGPGGNGPAGSGRSGGTTGAGGTAGGGTTGGGTAGSGPSASFSAATSGGSPSTTLAVLAAPKRIPARMPWLFMIAGAILLAAPAIRAIRKRRGRRASAPADADVRARPHSSTARLAVEQEPGAAPSRTIRLEPRRGVTNQVIEEVSP